MTYYFVLIFFLYGLGRFLFSDLKRFFTFLYGLRKGKSDESL